MGRSWPPRVTQTAPTPTVGTGPAVWAERRAAWTAAAAARAQDESTQRRKPVIGCARLGGWAGRVGAGLPCITACPSSHSSLFPRPEATYEDLLMTAAPFPRPIPLAASTTGFEGVHRWGGRATHTHSHTHTLSHTHAHTHTTHTHAHTHRPDHRRKWWSFWWTLGSRTACTDGPERPSTRPWVGPVCVAHAPPGGHRTPPPACHDPSSLAPGGACAVVAHAERSNGPHTTPLTPPSPRLTPR